jgi:hypothetical protein
MAYGPKTRYPAGIVSFGTFIVYFSSYPGGNSLMKPLVTAALLCKLLYLLCCILVEFSQLTGAYYSNLVLPSPLLTIINVINEKS